MRVTLARGRGGDGHAASGAQSQRKFVGCERDAIDAHRLLLPHLDPVPRSASVMPSMPIVCSCLVSISSRDRLLPPAAPANLPPICLESRHRGTSKVFPSSIQVATPRKSCAGEIKDARIPLSCVGWRSKQRDGRFHAAVTGIAIIWQYKV